MKPVITTVKLQIKLLKRLKWRLVWPIDPPEFDKV